MSEGWLRFPIYLNGEKRFDENLSGNLPAVDTFERIKFVFDNIEFCYAEGRMIDVDILDRLDTFRDQICDSNSPSIGQLADLADIIGSRYGLVETPNTGSPWIRRDEFGQIMIWIDRNKIVAESNKRLFGRITAEGSTVL